METIDVYTDGGSRGNPGPAAIGYVILQDGKVVAEKGEVINVGTNNFAEYTALLKAILALKDFLSETVAVNFYLDSELVVRQLNGEYKVKDINLRALYMEVMRALKDLNVPHVFNHIPREQNKRADALVNKALDGVS